MSFTQNNVPHAEVTRDSLALEQYGYIPRKPYPQPAHQGLAPIRAYVFEGYPNVVRRFLATNALKYITATGKVINYKRNLNTPAMPLQASSGFSGAAPVRGIYTGVHDDGCY